MGIEPFLVSSSILAVIAQRLVRVLCTNCRERYMPAAAELSRVGLRPRTWPAVRSIGPASKGCKNCRSTGYRGRTAIHELMVMDDDVRGLVMKNADAATIRRACTSKGMKLLRDNGTDRVLAGETTFEELLRVTQEDIM